MPVSGDGPAPVAVQVKTSDGRTASYALRSAAATLNTQPVGWPSETIGASGWTAYTQIGTPIRDKTAADGDPSTGGTTPQQDTDISRGDSPYYPSALYAFDSTTGVFFYRIRVNSCPLTNSALSGGTYTGGDPWDNVTWNLLIDTDGDGYKEFTVVLDGDSGGKTNSDIGAAAGSKDGDDLKIYYNNSPGQLVTAETVSNDQVVAPGDLVWWGNAGTKSASVPASLYDGATWDFGRTRCVYHTASNATWGAGWFVDFQFPISALTDAWNSGNGGRQIVGVNTPISFGYSTSNSNSNPLQKDFASTFAYTAAGSARFPFSDVVTLATGITQFPMVGSMTLSNIQCPNQVTVSTGVADALTVSPPSTGTGTVTDTIAEVTFGYYFDANGNGQADDGSSWKTMATVGSSLNPDTNGDLAPDGVTASFNDWGVVWNTAGLANGQYLIRVTAVDDEGHTTQKTVGSYVVDSAGGCRDGLNASWNSYSDADHLTPADSFSNTPPATVYMNGSFSPSTTYNVAYFNSAGAQISYSAVTSDTFGTMLSSQLTLSTSSPTGTYHSVVYPLSFAPPDTYNGVYNASTNPILADDTFVVTGPSAPVVNSPIDAGASSIGGTSSSPAGTTITVYEDGTPIGTTTVQSDGTWTLGGVSGLVGGENITAKAGLTDAQGPVSNTVVVTPAPPVVTGPINAGDASITGTSGAPDGTTITVYSGSSILGTATVSSESWTLSGVSGLAGGESITATATSNGQASASSNAIVVTPNAPVVDSPIAAGSTSVPGTSSAPSGSTITVFKNGSAIGTTTVQPDGTWTLGGLSPALVAGDAIKATATAGGQTSPDSNIVTVLAASVPPIVNSPLVAGPSQTITGSSVEAPGSVITVYVNGTNVGTTTVSADGTWTLAGVPLSTQDQVKATVLASGKAVSDFGNVVVVATDASSVTQPPVITPGIATGATSVSGTFPTATAGVTIDLYANGIHLGTTTTDANGNWTLAGLTALPGGTILSATATQTGSGTSNWSAPVVVGTIIDMLRDDSMTSLTAPPSTIFTHSPRQLPYPSLDPLGPNHVADWGEGTKQQSPGTSDDDKAYLQNVTTGTVDPDATVLTDNSRPLVFYQLLDNSTKTLYLSKSNGKIVFTVK